MDIKKYVRKPFEVNAVQVTLDNAEAVAKWCGGTLDFVSTRMMGTSAMLPCVKIMGQREFKDKEFTALIGFWVVERNGSFRISSNKVFSSQFDEVATDKHFDAELGLVLQDGQSVERVIATIEV